MQANVASAGTCNLSSVTYVDEQREASRPNVLPCCHATLTDFILSVGPSQKAPVKEVSLN